MSDVVVEPGGHVLRGIAVPYHEAALVIGPTPSGRMLHQEVFDEGSILDVGGLFGRPLLIGHDENRPIGRVRSSRSTPAGLAIEADLIGGDDEIEGLRRRLGAGVQRSLSIGFFPSSNADVWRQSERARAPIVTRRGVVIKEVSLVVWPAYDGAIVTGVHQRTAVGEQRELERVLRHVESELMIAEASEFLARRR